MNPELQRNVWLELNPTRLAVMPLVIGLIIMVASLGGGMRSVMEAAQMLFVVIAVVWGAFKAARTVTDEVRDRTWDSQRMSGLSPWAMTFGKLFGATIYCWYGGLIALAIYAATRMMAPAETNVTAPLWLDLLRLVLGAAFAQAVALSASLAGARRRRGQARADSFLFFAAGMAAYIGAESLHGANSVLNSMSETFAGEVMRVTWWGAPVDAAVFGVASLAFFTLLAALAAWRLMRVELQSAAQPVAYAVLAAAAILWFAGFQQDGPDRALAALVVCIGLTWATVWIEPKDVVAWRALAQGAPGAGALVPATLTALAITWTTAIAGAVLVATQGPSNELASALAAPAFAAFVTRDVLVFAFFHLGDRQKRGDFAAVLTIVLLYGFAPALLSGVTGSTLVKAAFYTDAADGFTANTVSLVSALIQAAAFGAMAYARFRARAEGLRLQPAAS
ncbi:MAG: hypothetical protein KJS97_16290 [Alphaproteobacteria bacterium]|nr:hypothetical protein [Alphaproteobacteria bacterium]